MTKGKLVTISRKGQVVIPKELRDFLHIDEGDNILMRPYGAHEVVISTPKEFAARSRGLLKGTWGKTAAEVDKRIRAERDTWE